MSKLLRALPLSLLLFTGGCAYDYASGYAPDYPPGYDSGMGSGDYAQPGDLFGGQNVTSIAVFFEPLAPYGGWVDSRWGRAFRPNAPVGWRPYVNGRWGENRLWISGDPWGWATDHYGRWGFDERLNSWVWVPGTEWAPSWVAWREAEGNEQLVGWSPVPPGVAYSFSVGFGTGWGYDNWNSWYAPGWIWVPSAYLYRPGFGGQIRPWTTGYNYWRGSHWNWNNGWQGRPGGWNGGGWNGGGWNGGRPGRPSRPPGNWGGSRPGVGDAIGGSIAGRPPRPPGERPPANWNGGNNGRPEGGWTGGNGGGRPPGGWSGGNGGGRPQGGWSGGNGGGRPPGGWSGGNGGGRPPGGNRPGRPSASLGDAIGGSLAEKRPSPAFQPPRQERPAPTFPTSYQPRPQPAERPAFQPRPERAERPQSRSETGMERPD